MEDIIIKLAGNRPTEMPEEIIYPGHEWEKLSDQEREEFFNKISPYMMSAKFEDPVKLPIMPPVHVMPGQRGEIEVPASKVRDYTNTAGAAIGTTVGAVAGAPGGFPGSATGAGVGAVTGRKLAEPVQRALGVRPREMGLGEGALLGFGSAVMEPFGPWATRGISRMVQSPIAALTLSTLSKNVSRARYGLYKTLGLKPPHPAGVMQSGLMQGIIGLQEKSIFTSKIYKNAAAKEEKEMLKVAQGLVGPRLGGDVGGGVLAKAKNRILNLRRANAAKNYGEVQEMLPGGANFPINSPVTSQYLQIVGYRGAFSDIAQAVGHTKANQVAKLIDSTLRKGQPIPYAMWREMRTMVRDAIKMGGSGDIKQGQLKQLASAMTKDLKKSVERAPQVGKMALKKLEKADRWYAREIAYYERVWGGIDKKVKRSEMFKELLRMAKGEEPDIEAIQGIFKRLNPEETGFMRSLVAQRIFFGADGNILPWNQIAARYNRHTNPIKTAIWGKRGIGLRDSLDTFAKIYKDIVIPYGTPRVSTNPLFSRAETAALDITGLGIFGGVGYAKGKKQGENPWTSALIGAAIYPLSMIGTSKLFTNQKFIRWMADTPKVKPGSLSAHIARLTTIYKVETDPDAREALLGIVGNLRMIGEVSDQMPRDGGR